MENYTILAVVDLHSGAQSQKEAAFEVLTCLSLFQFSFYATVISGVQPYRGRMDKIQAAGRFLPLLVVLVATRIFYAGFRVLPVQIRGQGTTR